MKLVCQFAILLVLVCHALLAQAPNQIVSIGYKPPAYPAVAQGQVITLYAAALNVPDAAAQQLPLPTTLSGVSVAVRVEGARDASKYPTSLGILRIQSTACVAGKGLICPITAITVQIPNDGVCAPTSGASCGTPTQYLNPPPLLVLNVKANGLTGPDLPMAVFLGMEHLLDSCDSMFGSTDGCHPLVTHTDGTLVSSDSPARVGETIVIYAEGLGLHVSAAVNEGMIVSYRQPTPPGYPTTIYSTVDHLVQPDYVGTAGDYGTLLYQINLVVPPMPAQTYQCQTATDINTIISEPNQSSVSICVRP
jgi:hypothetical protein